jgi:hypothetical protein
VKKEVKKDDIQIVTILLNKILSQYFSASSSLNFMDIKFRARRSLSTFSLSSSCSEFPH